MTGAPERRGFLRGLVALPLIGGGVTLMGQPSGVAEPVSRDLLAAYSEWLRMERRVLLHELFPGDAETREFAEFWAPAGGSPVGRFHLPPYPLDWRAIPQPSSRAALVLATVGCEWRTT